MYLIQEYDRLMETPLTGQSIDPWITLGKALTKGDAQMALDFFLDQEYGGRKRRLAHLYRIIGEVT